MLRFVVRRLLQLIPTLVGLSVLVFVWIRALPGSAAEVLLGDRADAESIARMRTQYGLDKSLPVQYWSYVKNLAQGDFGVSVISRRPVVDELGARVTATFELTVVAAVIAVAVGIPLGFYAAKKFGRVLDHVSLVVSLIGVSVPVFLSALLLKYVFGVKLGWLPTVGRIDPSIDLHVRTGFYTVDSILDLNPEALLSSMEHIILPAIAMSSVRIAVLARITRVSMLEVQSEDKVRTARAKGLPADVVDSQHVLRNGILPILTIAGLQAGMLLSGAVLTETVFAWQGLGTWLQRAIENRDYPVLQMGILVVAVIIVVANLLADLLYMVFDPRVRPA